MTESSGELSPSATAAQGSPRALARSRRGGWFAVLEREFLVATSRGGYVLIRTAVIAVVAAMALLILSVSLRYGRNVDGLALFRATAIGPMVLCALLGPGMAAATIAGERSMDTLPLVLAAPVSPGGFVMAKFIARLGALLLPLVGTIPITAVGLLYGGPPASALSTHVILLLLVAVMTVSSSVLASAYSKNVATATARGYVLAIGLPIVEMLAVVAYVAWERPSLSQQTLSAALSHNPVWVVGESILSTLAAPSVLPVTITILTLSALALLLAARRMGNEFAVAGGRQKLYRAKPIRFENPVLHRATPTSLVLPSGVRDAGVLALAALSAWYGVWFLEWDDGPILAGVFTATWIVALHLLVRSSQAFAPDRQKGSLALLRVAPITNAEQWRAHLTGTLCHALRLLLPAVVLALVAAIDREIRLWTVIVWVIGTAVLMTQLTAFGLWRSAVSATGGRAVGSTVGGFLVALAAVGLLALAVAWTADKAGMNREEYLVLPILASTPPGWHSMLVACAQDRSWGRSETTAFISSLVALPLSVYSIFVFRRLALRGLQQDT